MWIRSLPSLSFSFVACWLQGQAKRAANLSFALSVPRFRSPCPPNPYLSSDVRARAPGAPQPHLLGGHQQDERQRGDPLRVGAEGVDGQRPPAGVVLRDRAQEGGVAYVRRVDGMPRLAGGFSCLLRGRHTTACLSSIPCRFRLCRLVILLFFSRTKKRLRRVLPRMDVCLWYLALSRVVLSPAWRFAHSIVCVCVCFVFHPTKKITGAPLPLPPPP